MSGQTERTSKAGTLLFWLLCAAAFGLVVATQILPALCHRGKAAKTAPASSGALSATDEAVFATYGKSPSCKSCHEEAYALWEKSHHALAERPIDPAQDALAFESHYKIPHGSQISRARTEDGKFVIETMSADGTIKPFVPERVLGVDPLRQFLIPFPGGRYQLTELAFDPNHPDWFNVYGEEDRRPGEWGHWTGRGMTWNSMCAGCHNTRLRKNYRPSTDSYATVCVERGVGCETCHGPMADHNLWQARNPNQPGDPTVRRITREEMFAVCGSCHSRRGELTTDFRPTENYFDHFSLTIPDETDIFYPDGQIRDEDFEFTAFLGSRMHAAGVRCVDCHEPHGCKVRIPGNNLCMICHAAPAPPAPKVDPATHSHHQLGGRGDACTGCHMPQTVYMQRHARHDHGFTIPDPLLTKQFGIPNACTRCHADRDVDWSLDAAQKWYGEKMERPTRTRAQILARARLGAAESPAELVTVLNTDTNAFWRAVAANLLRRWSGEPKAAAALVAALEAPQPLLRAAAIRALEPVIQNAPAAVRQAVSSRLHDPSRLVRVDAAWALRASVDTNSPAGKDLLTCLGVTADQPAGALQRGVFLLDRGDLPAAMACFRRALSWDTNSAALYHALAIGLSVEGRTPEAVEALESACRLAPNDAEYHFKLGLALNEAGRLPETCQALEQAVKLDPQYSKAWYNLGLAYNACGKPESAVESLLRAEAIDAGSAQIPYARATILARVGRREEARRAAARALQIQPDYTDAAALLRTLSP